MDDPALDAEVHRRALRGLSRLNHLSGSVRVVWSALRELLPPPGSTPLRVLDLATGGGDVPIGLWRRARRAGASIRIDGCDVSPTAIEFARARAAEAGAEAGAEIGFFRLDVLSEPLPADYDILVCSLFLHHLSDDDAIDLLRNAAGVARRRIIVNDLRRGEAEALLVAAATRLVTSSRVVRIDGSRSVRAAFTAGELASLAGRAGLDDVVVRRRFPCRLLLVQGRT